MKICLLTHHSEANVTLAALTAENKRSYSARHGYDFITLRTSGDSWKVGVLKKMLDLIPLYDAVMTVGSDVLFMNHEIKIEDRYSVKDSVVMCREDTCEWPVNNDVAIWCNTPATLELVRRLIADFDIWRDYPWLWQNHLWNLMATQPAFMPKAVRMIEPRQMNATHGNGQNSRWQFGDWIIHFLGYSEAEKIALAKHYLAFHSTDGAFYPPATLFNRVRRLSLRNPKAVFIAMPCYDGTYRAETMQSITNFLMWVSVTHPDWMFVFAHLEGTGVPKLRDCLVHMGLEAVNPRSSKKDFGKLLFIDADIGCNPEQIMRICSHQHPVIGGMYPLKKKGAGWVWKPIPGVGPDKHGVQNVAGVGTGFKCFDMAVFEAYQQQYPELGYINNDLDVTFTGKKMHLYFREDIVEGSRMPEDYFFDYRVAKMGIPISADTTVKLGHFGTVNFLELTKP